MVNLAATLARDCDRCCVPRMDYRQMINLDRWSGPLERLTLDGANRNHGVAELGWGNGPSCFRGRHSAAIVRCSA